MYRFDWKVLMVVIIAFVTLANVLYSYAGAAVLWTTLVIDPIFVIVAVWLGEKNPLYFLAIVMFFMLDSFGFVEEHVGGIVDLFRIKDIFFVLSVFFYFPLYLSKVDGDRLTKAIKSFFILVLLYMALTFALTRENPILIMRSARSFLPIVLFFFMIKAVRDERDLVNLLTFFFVLNLVATSLYVFQGFSGVKIFPSYSYVLYSYGKSFIRGYAGYPVMVVPILLATMMMMIEKKYFVNKLVVRFTLGASLLAVLISFTRGQWLIAGAVVLFAFLFAGNTLMTSSRKRLRFGPKLIILATGFAAFFIVSQRIELGGVNPIFERLNEARQGIEGGNESESLLVRLLFISDRTSKAWNYDPILGIGFLQDTSPLMREFNLSEFSFTMTGFTSTDTGINEVLIRGLLFTVVFFSVILIFLSYSFATFKRTTDPLMRLLVVCAVVWILASLVNSVTSQVPINQMGATFSLCFAIPYLARKFQMREFLLSGSSDGSWNELPAA